MPRWKPAGGSRSGWIVFLVTLAGGRLSSMGLDARLDAPPPEADETRFFPLRHRTAWETLVDRWGRPIGYELLANSSALRSSHHRVPSEPIRGWVPRERKVPLAIARRTRLLLSLVGWGLLGPISKPLKTKENHCPCVPSSRPCRPNARVLPGTQRTGAARAPRAHRARPVGGLLPASVSLSQGVRLLRPSALSPRRPQRPTQTGCFAMLCWLTD